MQDRKTYAKGSTITTEGFRCSVGEPIDIKVTVGEDEEVELPAAAGKIIPSDDHLITLEVNGEKAAYRDLYHLGEDTVTVGDYTISDDMFLTGVSEDDEVVMRLEPVEMMVTDAFRAAVKKVAPSNSSDESSGGGSGGGVLVVHMVYDEEKDNEYTDKTWKEICDAPMAVIAEEISIGGSTTKNVYPILHASNNNGKYKVTCHMYQPNAQGVVTVKEHDLVTDSENGYLTYDE